MPYRPHQRLSCRHGSRIDLSTGVHKVLSNGGGISVCIFASNGVCIIVSNAVRMPAMVYACFIRSTPAEPEAIDSGHRRGLPGIIRALAPPKGIAGHRRPSGRQGAGEGAAGAGARIPRPPGRVRSQIIY